MAVVIDTEKCIGCGACVTACPVEALTVVEQKAVVSEGCVECRACVAECPVEAIG